MPGEEIQEIVKNLVKMWKEQGKNISPDALRKWVQPHTAVVSQVLSNEDGANAMKSLISEAFPEGEWQGAVALNQVIYLSAGRDIEKTVAVLKKAYEVWAKQPLNFSAFVVEWRKRMIGSTLDPEIVLETLTYDPSKQSFFDPDVSQRDVDFFRNVYREELGLDIDALAETIAKLVGDEHVDEFFRLVDIDKPVEPEEFVKRVNKAVEVLSLAKEQGLDVKKILREWDRLADEGGERLEKLSRAVKAVAEDVVKQRFWDELIERMHKLKVPVIEENADVSELLTRLHALDMVEINGANVNIGKEMNQIMELAVEILLKTEPSAIYTAKDLLKIVNNIISGADTKEEALFIAETLARMKVATLKTMGESAERIISAIGTVAKRGGTRPEEVAMALDILSKKGAHNTEDLAQAIYNKIHEIKER